MIEIVTYKHIHQQGVIDLILSIQRNEFHIPIDLSAQPDLKHIAAYYQKDHGNFWIAEMDKEIIGTIALLNIGNHQGALRKMFVHADYRGSKYGVGQQLLNTLLEWAREKNFAEIFLGTTEKFVRAQHFYEKNHFTEINKHKLPETFPVMEVDVKFYKIEMNSTSSPFNGI